jgi:TIR domain
VRFKFMPAASPIWNGAKGLFEPFQRTSLGARSVRLSPVDSEQKLFLVVAPHNENGLLIDGLFAGSDTLEMRISGVAWVTVNNRPISPTFREWISASSLRANLVGLFNLAIFCGAFVVAAGSPKAAGRVIQFAAGRSGIQIPSPAHGLVVFLCHCSEDKAAVRQIDRALKSDGFQPWLDEDDIFPARAWNAEIEQGLRSSHAVVVCLSKTFSRKEGYVQKELRYAIDLAREKPDGTVFLIPIRLEESEILPSLADLQFIDWFKHDGHDKLLRALRERARQVGLESTRPASIPDR